MSPSRGLIDLPLDETETAMLTARARWILTIAAGVTVLSLLVGQDGLALVGLSVVTWLVLAWLGFSRRVSAADQVLRDSKREIDGQQRAALILNVGQSHIVDVSTFTSAQLSGLRLWLEDVVPPGCCLEGTAPGMVAEVFRHQHLNWQYTLRPTVLGKLVLPGIQVKLSDSSGLLQARRFVPLRQELTVLPFLIRPQNTVPELKPKNSQLLLGQHRHHNPGISGELLSIRDYQPGDAPRTIAWKASARLGRLMTCEYESEVPIRATIICDLSRYQFVGRPGPAVADRVVSTTGSIARLLLSNRDPVACIVVNESNRLRVRHAHGERQLTRLLHSLLSHLSNQTVPGDAFINDLIETTWTACFHRFPELFDPSVNPQTGLFRLTRHSRLRVRRQQLAFALAQLHAAPIGFACRLMEDDREFRNTCRRFLGEHPSYRVPSVTVLDIEQQWRCHRQATNSVCRAVMEGVARARDNELFVLVGTLPLDSAELQELENSLRVARAAHHRVILLSLGEEAMGAQFTDPTAINVLTETQHEAQLGMRAETERRLVKLGVKMADVDSPSLTEEIASEVELLRFGRMRQTSVGRR